MKLKGKVAIVTGGSRGIGAAIVLKLASEGADVVIVYRGNEKAAALTEQEAQKFGVKTLIYQADVSQANEVEAMVEKTISFFGKIDILVNNAGITDDNLVMRMKEASWNNVIQTNLTSVFLLTKAVNRQLFKQRSGRIINITSVVGLMGNMGQANYAAAKAGLIGLTKSCAREFASRNITVNAVAPGFIHTDMTDGLSEDIKTVAVQAIPLKTFGQPQDIANCVAFLASDEAKYITGEVIRVDGGMAM